MLELIEELLLVDVQVNVLLLVDVDVDVLVDV